MKRNKKFRWLLAGLALALLLQPLAGAGPGLRQAKAADVRAWQNIGEPLSHYPISGYRLAVQGTDPYLAHIGAGQGLYVQTYENGNWRRDSLNERALEQVTAFELFMTDEGKPYVAYSSSGDGYRVAVASPNEAGEWDRLGGSIAGSASRERPGAAVDSQGGVYVIYKDENNGNAATVHKLDNGDWGASEIVLGQSHRPAIAVDASDRPIMAAGDNGSPFYEPVVKAREADGQWSNMNLAELQSGHEYTLKTTPSGEMYLHFIYGNSTNNQNKIWRWTASDGWSPIGNFPGYYGAMDIDPTDNRPVVVYRSTYDVGGTLHIVKWDGTAWNAVGEPGLQDYSWYIPTSVAVGEDGTPYIAYINNENKLRVVGYLEGGASPALIGAYPANGATEVAADAVLKLTFSEPVWGIGGKQINICDTSDDCEEIDVGEPRVKVRETEVEIEPDGKWKDGATLSVTIEAGAFASMDHSREFAGLSDGGWSFSVEDLPPAAIEWAPSGPDQSGTPIYMLRFDQETVAGVGFIELYRASDDELIDSVRVIEETVSVVDGKLALTGNVSLPPDGAGYYVLVTPGAFKDAGGTDFAGIADKTKWTFSTINENMPLLISTAPEHQSAGSVVSSLEMTFNKEIGAVEGKRVKLYQAGEPDPYDIDASEWVVDGATASLQLPRNLPAGQSFYVTVENGAFEDLDGNPFAGIADDRGWTFTTAAAAVPQPPTNVAATAGDGRATVTFDKPDYDGGEPIEKYKVTAWSGGLVAATADSDGRETSVIVRDLANGTAYRFSASAYNANGWSGESELTDPVVPAGVPGLPGQVAAAPGNESATVAFEAPESDGGTSVTTYRVRWQKGADAPSFRNVPANETSVTIGDLTKGASYTFSVAAGNAAGLSGFADAASAVVPYGPPDAPGTVSATGGDGKAYVSFGPASLYGAENVGYEVTAWDGTSRAGTVSGNSSPIEFPGLTNGRAYTFTVKTTTEYGESAASPPSNAATPAKASSGNGSGGGGGGSPSGRVILIDVSSDGIPLGQLGVEQRKDAEDRLVQSLTITERFVADAAPKLAQAGAKLLTIRLEDSGSPPDLRSITLMDKAAAKLAELGITLDIRTPEAGIAVPPSSLSGLTEPAEWILEPIRSEGDIGRLAARARSNPAVAEKAGGGALAIRGLPVDIETNLQGREAELTLPLSGAGTGSGLPDDAGIYIEHSDGGTELLRGRSARHGERPAIAFTVDSFSTFAVVEISGWTAFAKEGPHDNGAAYIGGYPDGLFRPGKGVTRAEMAVILTKLLNDKANGKTSGGKGSFKDVPAAYWASTGIATASRSGWMKGYPDGSFRPDKIMTRAEMAALLSAIGTRRDGSGNSASFSDIANHWAEAEIRRAQSDGYLNGYADGTFRPDRILTRAEAVVILNKLLGRVPEQPEQPRFADVPASHWAYGAIQAASRTE